MSSPVDPLLSWLEDPHQDNGIHFASGREGWDYWSYVRLAARAREVAAGLQNLGVRTGANVLITARSGPDFVTSLYGTLLAGATPSPVAPPGTFGERSAYQDHLERVIKVAEPDLLLTDGPPDTVLDGPARLTAVGVPVDARTFEAGCSPREVPPAELALLQFTSGSTSAPRGVRVPFSALGANIAAILPWLDYNSADAQAHWLPFYHDMGLIGCLIAPVTAQAEIWNMQPEQFVRNPLRYLACFGRGDARVGTLPNFGLDYILRRVRAEHLEGYDFSRMTTLVLGSERLNPQGMERFQRLLEPFGFGDTVITPAYGLAEATLAVTGTPRDRAFVVSTSDGDSGRIVGCGKPLPGLTVEVVDDEGSPVPDGTRGAIEITGPSVAAGYQGDGNDAFAGGRLRTGDVGFLRDGELYVIGRLGDGLKIRGRPVFAADLEMELAGSAQLKQPAVVVLGTAESGTATVVVLIRRLDRLGGDAVATVLRAVVEDADLVVMAVGDRTVERTTSGKPRRRMMWQRFVSGDLTGEVVFDSRTPEAAPSSVASTREQETA